MSTVTATPPELESLIAAGAQVLVRDEEWLVTQVQQTPADGLLVRCIGTSTLVRDTEATFFSKLDAIWPLNPEETVLVNDPSPQFRMSRLYLEALIRKTPVPVTEGGLVVSHDQLLVADLVARTDTRQRLAPNECVQSTCSNGRQCPGVNGVPAPYKEGPAGRSLALGWAADRSGTTARCHGQR